MRFRFFDRSGSEISEDKWGRLTNTRGYKVLANDEIYGLRVLTLWVGMNCKDDGAQAPPIFETVTLGKHGLISREHYRSEEDALRGHAQVLGAVRAICEMSEEA